MSLQVWLPLNGSLENLGLSDTSQISTSNLSFSDNGKIGRCVNGYTGYFNIPSMTGKKQLSVAYWIRINTATVTNWLDAFRWYSTNGSETYVSRNEFYNDSTRTGVWYKGGSLGDAGLTYTVGTWRHHAFTIDYESGEANFYINGVRKYTISTVDTTHYLTGTNFMIGENGLDTSHNDVRIYDHILSAKEVKELSKGLVAHYPLNDFVGNPNLVSTVIAGGRTTVLGKYTVQTTGEDKDTYFQIKTIESLVSGTAYTLSMDAENLLTTGSLVFRIGDQNASSDKYAGQMILYNGHNSFTFTCPSGLNGLTQFILDDVNRGAAIGQNVLISNVKFEEGSVPTPWIPNVQDNLYSAMGLDENVIYDCSGYGHHGENTGCTPSSESARYKVSTAFDGTSYITLHNDSFPVILSNDFTLLMWIYSDDDGDRSLWLGNYGISNGGNFFGFEKTASNGVRFWWNSGNPDKYFATYITKSEGWVLLTLVKEGNTAKIYKNGILSATDTNSLYESASLPSTATTFRLGADGRITGNTLFKGSMSDVRIYCTALSADDIKALYETSVSIDDKGNFHAYEISEV